MSDEMERTRVDPVWLAIVFFASNFLFTLVVFFVLGYAVNDLQELAVMHVEQVREVEERVTNLERQDEALETRIESAHERINGIMEGDWLFRQQIKALNGGTFIADGYADLDKDKGVCFEKPPQDFGDTFHCGWLGMMAGSDFSAVLYSTSTGEVLNEFNVGRLAGPGDHVIAWYAEEATEAGYPISPELGLRPYFWDQETGLAVAITTFSGGNVVP